MSSKKIDHSIIDRAFSDDPAGDPEGAANRAAPNQRAVHDVPPWVAEEFGWIFTGRLTRGMSEDDERLERMKDGNWRFRAHAEVVKAVEAQCQPVYDRHLDIVENTDEGKAIQNGYYQGFKSIFVHAAEGPGGDQWCAYGLGLALVAQGCKEVASSVRFAMRADNWQARLNEQQDFENLGPSNMMEKARAQAIRGVAICEAAIKAYNSTVQDERATRLSLNFLSATYTALGIEAANKAKDYEHPGKSLSQSAAAVGASGAIMGDFFGTST